MDNPLWLIVGGFALTMIGLLVGYLLGRWQPETSQPVRQPSSRRPTAPTPTMMSPAAFAKKWPNPPSRVIEIPSRTVEAMSRETAALDLDGDGQVALKVSVSTSHGRTRYALRNEEEGVTHEYESLDEVPAQWRPIVDRFLATQREIFGGKAQTRR